MASIEKFEDLVCWQKARLLAKEIYGTFKICPDHGLKNQIQRAAVSIMSNIAEGFERGTKQELVNYLFIAKGSAGEVRSQLYIALDAGYLNIETFKYLNSLVIECSRLIQSFSGKVKSSMHSGLHFKQVPKSDPMKEITMQHSPELYERFYGKDK